jgi:hypothetical protein
LGFQVDIILAAIRIRITGTTDHITAAGIVHTHIVRTMGIAGGESFTDGVTGAKAPEHFCSELVRNPRQLICF